MEMMPLDSKTEHCFQMESKEGQILFSFRLVIDFKAVYGPV